MKNRYLKDPSFYRRVMGIAVPIMIQNAITNFVSLLDNVMVGQVGTVQMSGVAIVNQLIFVFNLCVFGAVSGAGIFTAQFYGKEDHEGVRHTFRFKVLICVILAMLGITALSFGGSRLIMLYLRGEGDPADAAYSLQYGLNYLAVMLIGLVPFALSNAYSATLRETGETVVPMAAGISAVLVNLVLNYVLIFGHFGAPQLGVVGAAVATVASRFVELGIVAGWTHTHTDRSPFIVDAYRSFKIPGKLLKSIIIRGLPLLVNEALWSAGMATLNQCYSVRGLDVVAATNISSTIYNVCSVAFFAMGGSVGILIGQMLGAGCKEDEVREADTAMILMSVTISVVMGILLASLSGVFPKIYNTTDSVRTLATGLMCVGACLMPVNAYVHSAYFTIRSGGQTFITFLFDSCFMWVCSIPVALALSRLTNMPIIPMYACCQAVDIIKCIIGFILIRRGAWIQNLTEKVAV